MKCTYLKYLGAVCFVRDRPFLSPGTRVKWIHQNLPKSFIPNENTKKKFRTPSKGG